MTSFLSQGGMFVALIVIAMSIWNVFLSAGEKFSQAQQAMSNFEFIIYTGGMLSLAIVSGHFFVELLSTFLSFFKVDLALTTSRKIFSVVSLLTFVYIYFRSIHYNKIRENQLIEQQKRFSFTITNDTDSSCEIRIYRSRWVYGGYGDVFRPEYMFEATIYPNEKIQVRLKNDDAYGVMVDRMHFDVNEHTPHTKNVSEYIKEAEEIRKRDKKLMENF